MKRFKITVNNQEYDVTVEEIKEADVAFKKTEVINTIPEKKEAPIKKVNNSNDGNIISPMPGTILDVRCSVGQSVKAGNILFILEAMKMENEIVAPKDGVIEKVAVNKGNTVGTDDLLAIIK